MQLIARSAFAALVLALSLVAASPSGANAVVSTTGFGVTGPGLKHSGREISVSFSILNEALDPTTTPDVVDKLLIAPHSIHFNGKADTVATCQARLPKNGDPARCPRRSKVGSGKIAAILGTPGQPADAFGPLSTVTGTVSFFNYKRGGSAARLLAVIKTHKPFAGVAINLVVPINRQGVISVDFPRVSQLPAMIRRSYPKGTRLVVKNLTAKIVALRRRQSKPFIWLQTPGRIEVGVTTIS